MIDIEPIVLDTVAKAVWAEYQDADVSADYIPTPENFPYVYIHEVNNSAYRQSFDDKLKDHHVNVAYSVDVFALDKATAKAVRNIVDNAMQSMKFTRTMAEFTPNLDRTIKRYTLRYTAVVGELNNNTYQMYRS